MPEQKPMYGGRALPNGVMMVGPDRVAVAIRKPDGSITTESSAFQPPLSQFRRTPFVRGPVAMASALILAIRSGLLERKMTPGATERRSQMIRTILPVVGVSLLERVLRGIVRRPGSAPSNRPTLSMMFLPLLAFRLLGLTGPGKELLRYHAAEHMAVNSAESEAGLSTDGAMTQSRIHPRCGTSFAFWTLILTWLLGRKADRGPLATLFLSVATISVSFELLHFGARNRQTPWVQKVFGPSWSAQYLTTSPPEREHVEVAVAALAEVMNTTVQGDAEPDIV